MLTVNITTSSLYSVLMIYFVITNALLLPGLVKRLWCCVEVNDQHNFFGVLCDVQYLVPFCFLVFGYEEAATVSCNVRLQMLQYETSILLHTIIPKN